MGGRATWSEPMRVRDVGFIIDPVENILGIAGRQKSVLAYLASRRLGRWMAVRKKGQKQHEHVLPSPSTQRLHFLVHSSPSVRSSLHLRPATVTISQPHSD